MDHTKTATRTFAQKVNSKTRDSESTRKEHIEKTSRQVKEDYQSIRAKLIKIDGYYSNSKTNTIEDILEEIFYEQTPQRHELRPDSKILTTLREKNFDQKGESEGIPPELVHCRDMFVAEHFK